MISTEHVIDFDNLVLTSKEVYSDWKYLISENDGHYSEDSQFLYFDYKGIEVIIGFELTLRGWSYYQPENFDQPSYGDERITDVEIGVNYLMIGEEEVSLDENLQKTLTQVVKKYVKYE